MKIVGATEYAVVLYRDNLGQLIMVKKKRNWKGKENGF